MNERSLLIALNRLPLKEVRYFDTVGSTNDVALAWADQGSAEDGSLVVANAQTAGRGRLDRSWVTQPGSALAFSLILRPGSEPEKSLALHAPLGALAVSIALEALGLNPQIKWPNDVLLNRRKVAGILSEAAWSGAQAQHVVLGIGVNVTPGSLPPAETLRFPATCVAQELGNPVEREGLLASVLGAFFEWRPRLYTSAFIQAWEQRLAFCGEWVMVGNAAADGAPLVGRLLGVSGGGALRIEMDDGREEQVLAGDLSLRPV